jgi:probable F420-dependent oxidoreductase
VSGPDARHGQVGVWGHLDSLSPGELRRYAQRVEVLGFGTLWVPETVGREPFALLAAIAAATDRLHIGTSIASIWARDAVTTRLGALTLQDLSGGRFVLGLGVSHAHLAQKVRGHVYERPLSRMREYLAAYHAAPWRGPAVAEEPPIVLAALRRRMLELAAHATAGAFPYLVTSDRVAWMRGVVDSVPDAPHRPLLLVTLPVVADAGPETARAAARTYLAPYLRTPNYQASWSEQGFEPADWEKPGSDRLVDGLIAWGGAEELTGRVRAMHDAGADHVALIPLAPDGTTEHLPSLEVLAR